MRDINLQHAMLVHRLCKDGRDILNDLTPYKAHLLHMVLGVTGEAGELLDAIKKFSIYDKTLDTSNIIEELGDIEFYMQGIRSALNINRDEVLAQNVAKLTKRYGEQYSNQAAIERADKQDADA